MRIGLGCVMILVFLLTRDPCEGVLHAEERQRAGNRTADAAAVPLQESAIASDLTPRQLAQEIKMLQQQMGGSVVESTLPPHWENPSSTSQALITDQPPNGNWSTYPAPHRADFDHQRRHVDELREVAFHLDSMAHRLEKLDLYENADALRQVANRIRHDARRIKQDRHAPATQTSPQPSATPSLPTRK
ncbi:MAG: hypothetical protein AAGD11_07755 [Planctomycetota bacterium]